MRIKNAALSAAFITLAFALSPAIALADGSQSFTSPGTYSFTVPTYSTLSVTVNGAGGGGQGGGSLFGAYPQSGGSGIDSWFNGSVYGGGGQGGFSQGCGLWQQNVSPYAGCSNLPANGSPGSASGGSSNVTGGGASGGAGGTGYSASNGGSGGSGGQASITYGAGALTPGSNVTVVVGQGGQGGAGAFDPNTGDGASGGDGSVYISWTSPQTPATATITSNGQQNLVISSGAGYTVAWNSSNVSSCTISYNTNGGSGSFGVSPNTPGSGASGAIGSYTITCNGNDGTTPTATTNISTPSCSVSLSPNPAAYSYSGTPVTLSWNSTSATQVYINNIGWVGTSGSTQVAAHSSTDYSCYGYNSSYAATGPTNSATLTVNAPPAPTATISPSPATIYTGQSSTITGNYTAGTGDIGVGTDIEQPLGTAVTGTAPTSPKTYSFSTQTPGTYTFYARAATQYYGTWTTYAQTSVTVNQGPTCSVAFSQNPILRGQSATINYTSANATGFSINNVGALTPNISSSVVVSPNISTDYTGTASVTGDSTTCKAPAYGSNPAGTLVVQCTQSWSCSGQTIVQTNSDCSTTNLTTCVSPAFCSPGSSSCLYPQIVTQTNLQATPSIVQSGARSSIKWNVQNAQSCTVTGGNGDSWSGLSSGANGTTTSKIIAATVYTLSCTPYGANPPLNQTVQISLAPSYQEI